jgi:hypothetical protein
MKKRDYNTKRKQRYNVIYVKYQTEAFLMLAPNISFNILNLT